MKRRFTKKLTLNKESITSLNPDEMSSAKGGLSIIGCITNICTYGCTIADNCPISGTFVAPCCI